MNTIDQVSRKPCTKLDANPNNGVDGVETEDEDNNFKPLTAQEAEEWRSRQRAVSIWRVLGWQLLVGVSVGFLWWGGFRTTRRSPGRFGMAQGRFGSPPC
jgi:hypothetical protein